MQVNDKEIEEKASSLLKEKHWKEFEIEKPSLSYFPHYFFEGKATGLNAADGKTSEETAKDFSEHAGNLSFKITHDHSASVEKTVVEKAAVEKQFGKAKTFYYPVWRTAVKLDGRRFGLLYSAVTGRLFGKESIPKREKSITEIAAETLSELRNPEAWARYAKEIFAEAKKAWER